MNEKFEQYAKDINQNKTRFVNNKLLESLIRIEEKEVIDETANLNALEMLSKLE